MVQYLPFTVSTFILKISRSNADTFTAHTYIYVIYVPESGKWAKGWRHNGPPFVRARPLQPRGVHGGSSSGSGCWWPSHVTARTWRHQTGSVPATVASFQVNLNLKITGQTPEHTWFTWRKGNALGCVASRFYETIVWTPAFCSENTEVF